MNVLEIACIFWGCNLPVRGWPRSESLPPLDCHRGVFPTTKILRLSQDLPVVAEIVDSQEKIDGFLPALDTMMTNGLVTIEKVQVLQYGPDKS
jgi:hypothetical protein